MLAVYYNNPSFLRKLLSHGADINITGLNKDDNVHKSEGQKNNNSELNKQNINLSEQS